MCVLRTTQLGKLSKSSFEHRSLADNGWKKLAETLDNEFDCFALFLIRINRARVYSRVYQNLVTSSKNYRTSPKVGPHYKEKACNFLARSNYSFRPNSCVLFKIFVARRKISTAQ